jgi:hypothetical protein
MTKPLFASLGPIVEYRFFVSSAYSSSLKVGAICSSEILVNFYQMLRHQMSEDSSFIILNLLEVCDDETQLRK